MNINATSIENSITLTVKLTTHLAINNIVQINYIVSEVKNNIIYYTKNNDIEINIKCVNNNELITFPVVIDNFQSYLKLRSMPKNDANNNFSIEFIHNYGLISPHSILPYKIETFNYELKNEEETKTRKTLDDSETK